MKIINNYGPVDSNDRNDGKIPTYSFSFLIPSRGLFDKRR